MAALLLACPWSSSSSSFTTGASAGLRPLLSIRKVAGKEVTRWQQQLRCTLKVDVETASAGAAAVEVQQSSVGTTTLPEIRRYEVSYRSRESGSSGAGVKGKGWTDAEGKLDGRWVAKFRALAVVAADRVEMHGVLANQRSNWNHLFHQTIIIAAVSAATVAAINGAEPGPGLSLMAASLNLMSAAFMALVNQQQPSQLAEEQRRAARFFKRLMKDVESTLEIDPDMREEASIYWEGKVGALHALDGAFPLPLTPGGLEKFPQQVLPPELSSRRKSDRDGAAGGKAKGEKQYGWTQETADYLRENIDRIETRDIPILIRRAKGAKSLNLAMVRVSPFLAVAGALCSIASSAPPLLQVPWLAAALTVGAVFTHSMSHALQLGSGFEMYRNYAGYYEDVGRAAQRMLDLPAHLREDWDLFRERFNLQLGHHPLRESVDDNDDHVGRLF